MIDTYLFDWGDTLMVDFPNISGKMCDWAHVEAIDGAKEVLAHISKYAQVYIATGADESSEEEIKRAFERVGLAKFISGYFCKSNLGMSKGSPEFLKAILTKLGKSEKSVVMIGDSLEKDIKPAVSVGIKAILLNKEKIHNLPHNTIIIHSLHDLY